MLRDLDCNTGLINVQDIIDEINSKVDKTGDTMSGNLEINSEFLRIYDNTYYSKVFNRSFEIGTIDSAYLFQMIPDLTDGGIDFKINNDTSFTVQRAKAPTTKYQPLEVNSLTRKDYVDNAITDGLAGKLDLTGGTLTGKLIIDEIEPLEFSTINAKTAIITEGVNMNIDGKFHLTPRLNNDSAWDLNNSLTFDFLQRRWKFSNLYINDNRVIHEGDINNLPISQPIQDELDLKYNKTGGLITGDVLIGDGNSGNKLTIRGGSTGKPVILFNDSNNTLGGFIVRDEDIQSIVFRNYDISGNFKDVKIENNGNVAVSASSPTADNHLTIKGYVDDNVETREPVLPDGVPGHFLSLASDGSKVWKEVDVPEGDFVPIDGRTPMSGNLTIGNGTSGNTLNIRGSSYSDYQNIIFKRSNNSTSANMIYTEAGDLKITKYHSDGRILTQLTFTDSGNVSVNGVYPLLSTHLTNKGYVDSFFFKRNDFIDVSTGHYDAGKPVILNANGELDSSMIPIDSGWQNQGTWTPTSSQEYPDTSSTPSGSYWSVVGVDDTNGYVFTTGDLTGQTAYNGNLMIWAGDAWELRDIEINPFDYYKLDGSQPITGDFAGGGFRLTNIADGVVPTDGATINQLNAKQDDLGFGTHQQVLMTIIDESSNATLEWYDLPQIEGNYLPIDGSEPMTGNLTIGDGNSGNSLSIQALSYTGRARQWFLKSNKDYGASFTYDEANDLFYIRKHSINDNSIDSELILDSSGNVRLGISTNPTHNEHLITKKYLESQLNTKEDYLGTPSSDFYVLASDADGSRYWTPMSTDDPSHIDPGEYITGTIGTEVKNIFGIEDTGNTIILGDSEAGNSTPLYARGAWDFQTTSLTVNGTDIIWHSGNDGHTSGLDADTVDGIEGSLLVQKSRVIDTTDGIVGGGTLDGDLTLSHATGDDWNHLPSGGSNNQVVKYNGTDAIWANEIGGKLWLATDTYNKGDIVSIQNGAKYDTYVSLEDGNSNNPPASSPSHWYATTSLVYFVGIFEPHNEADPWMPDATSHVAGATWIYNCFYDDGSGTPEEHPFTYPDDHEYLPGLTVNTGDSLVYLGKEDENDPGSPDMWYYSPKATVSEEKGGVPWKSNTAYQEGTLVVWDTGDGPKIWYCISSNVGDVPGESDSWVSLSDKKLNITGGQLFGDLYIGDGNSGDSLHVVGNSSNGSAKVWLKRNDLSNAGLFYYDVNTDQVKLRRYDSDGTNISTDLRLETDGNVSVYNLKEDSIPAPNKDENLTTKKYVDSGLSGKENSLGNPGEDGMLLSSATDGTRSWVAAPKTIPELTPGDFITGENIGGTIYEVFGVPDSGTELQIGSSNTAFPTSALGNWGFTGIVDIAELTVGTINGGTPWTSANPGLGNIGEVLGTVDDGNGNPELGWVTGGSGGGIPHFEPGDFMTATIAGTVLDIFGIGSSNDTIYIGDTTADNTTPVICRGDWDFQGTVNVVKSETRNMTGSQPVHNMVWITSEDYANLPSYDDNTIYVIVNTVNQ